MHNIIDAVKIVLLTLIALAAMHLALAKPTAFLIQPGFRNADHAQIGVIEPAARSAYTKIFLPHDTAEADG